MMSASTRWVISLLFILGGLSSATAQPTATPIAHTETLTLTSAYADGYTYQLHVTLPEGYDESRDAYPVVYYLDGWLYAELMAGIYRVAHGTGRLQNLILVGLSVDGDRTTWARHRFRDYTPTPYDTTRSSFDLTMGEVSTRTDATGGAPAFYRFLVEEAIPTIEQRYRARPTDRGLIGHSFGGLFATWVLQHHPEVFTRVLVACPSLWWNQGELLGTEAFNNLASGATSHTVFLTVGGKEPASMTSGFARAQALLDALPKNRLTLHARTYADDNHTSGLADMFADGLYVLYGR